MKRGLYLLVLVSISCGGKSGLGGGPGLPACSRPATAIGCVATWTGVVSGSTNCSTFAETFSGEWGFSADGMQPNTLFVQASMPSAPVAGQSFALHQLSDGLIQLDVGSAWWGATPLIGGDLLLHVDEVVPGSQLIHGSVAGSLVRGSGGSDSGVQICVTF